MGFLILLTFEKHHCRILNWDGGDRENTEAGFCSPWRGTQVCPVWGPLLVQGVRSSPGGGVPVMQLASRQHDPSGTHGLWGLGPGLDQLGNFGQVS